MSLTIPPYKDYNNLRTPIAVFWRDKPDEGDQAIPLEFDWDGTDNCFRVSYGASGLTEFKRAAAIYVNNINNGSNCSILFPDTNFELDVPAGTCGMFPVTTNAASFYAVSSNASNTDKTFAVLYNSYPPPVALASVVLNNIASVNGIDLSVAADHTIVASGTNGTLSSLDVSVDTISGGAGADQVQILIEDGTGKLLFVRNIYIAAGAAQQALPPSILNNINVPFMDGIIAHVTAFGGTLPAAGSATINLYYRS